MYSRLVYSAPGGRKEIVRSLDIAGSVFASAVHDCSFVVQPYWRCSKIEQKLESELTSDIAGTLCKFKQSDVGVNVFLTKSL